MWGVKVFSLGKAPKFAFLGSTQKITPDVLFHTPSWRYLAKAKATPAPPPPPPPVLAKGAKKPSKEAEKPEKKFKISRRAQKALKVSPLIREHIPAATLRQFEKQPDGTLKPLITNPKRISAMTKLINKHIKEKKYTEAEEVFKQMKVEEATRPTIVTYTSMMSMYEKAGDMDKLFQTLEEMKLAGYKPDQFVYTILIDSYSKKGLINEMDKVLQQMKSEGLRPSHVTYNAFIRVYGRGGDMKKVFEIVELMRKEHKKTHNSTHNTVLDVCGYSNQLDKMLEYLQHMKQHKIRITEGNFLTILKWIKLKGNSSQSAKVLDEMYELNIWPQDRHLALALQTLYKEKKFNEVDELFAHAQREKAVGREVYLELLNIYAETRNQQKILSIFPRLAEYVPDKSVMIALLSALGVINRLKEMRFVYERIKQSHKTVDDDIKEIVAKYIPDALLVQPEVIPPQNTQESPRASRTLSKDGFDFPRIPTSKMRVATEYQFYKGKVDGLSREYLLNEWSLEKIEERKRLGINILEPVKKEEETKPKLPRGEGDEELDEDEEGEFDPEEGLEEDEEGEVV